MKHLLLLAAIAAACFSQVLAIGEASAQGHNQVVADSPEPQTVFDHHDANKNGVLEPDEFAKAYNFSPSRDCVKGGGVDSQDPRCQGHATHRGRSGEYDSGDIHIHIHHYHH